MTTLLSILDDPSGKLVKETSIQLHWLQSLYDSIVVIATDRTLYHEFLNPVIYPMSGLGQARRLALKHGLELNSNYFHYCDLDRILYWAKFYPDELISVTRLIPSYEFLIFGRTPRAFDTHPELQRITEQECNRLFGCGIDILSGSRSFSRRIAQDILVKSRANGAGTDAEWPLIAKRFHYVECSGLEYESIYFDIVKPDPEESRSRFNNLDDVKRVIIEHKNG